MQLVFRIALTLYFILCVSLTHAAIFIVTSKADMGPGTLRDAINQANANGTTGMDYIHFNLPGVSPDDHIIRIETEMPVLSSNIEIDGTTQPGTAFGISHAKVKVLKDNYHAVLNGYKMFSIVDADNVNVYGMYLEITPAWNTDGTYCMNVTSSSNITIGAKDKGNVLIASDGLIMGLGGTTTDLHIAYNLLGVNPDGVSIPAYIMSYPSIVLLGAGNVEIDHNQICSWVRIGENFSMLVPLGKRNYKIHDNIGGGDYTGTRKIGSALFSISTYPRTDIRGDNNIEVLNNHVLEGYFSLGGGYGTVLIQGNRINTDIAGTTRTGQVYANCTIELFRVQKALIGGSKPSEKNYISGFFGGVSCSYDEHVTITKNSIFCNGKGIVSRETVFVTAFTPTTVSGTSEPEAIIEVFDADNCSGAEDGCEGKVYLGTTIADANGKWSYTGALPENVVVTGTNKEGATSEFTRATINQDRADVTNSFCGKPGSIKGIKVTGAVVLQWEDASGKVVGHDEVLTAPPGKYTLWANTNNNPHGKCAVSCYYTILGVQPGLTTEQVKLVHPCHDKNGAIYNITDKTSYYTSKYKWLNEKDEVVGTSANLTNVPAGTYRLYAYITDDCFAVSDPIVLTDNTPPTVSISTAKIQDATCSDANGAISGINVTGVSPYTFRWLNENSDVVGTDVSLQKVAPGEYRLELTDNSGCVPVTTDGIKVKGVGTISVDATNVKIIPAGCGTQGGTISGLGVVGADTYTWRNEAGNTVGTGLDLKNIPEGNFQLTATNKYSCSAQTTWYKVNKAMPAPWVVNGDVQFPVCNEANGSIQINNIQGNVIKSLKWMNATTNSIISNERNVRNVGPGNYTLYITDENDCEQQAYTTEIPQRTAPLLSGSPLVTDETCGFANGSIQAPAINGEAPFTYRWKTANGREAGNESQLKGVGKGVFTLTVTDKYGCITTSSPAIVNNREAPIISPGDLYYTIGKGQPVELKWTYNTPVLFTLYADVNLTHKISQNSTGNFSLPALFVDTRYYVTAGMDICTSKAGVAYVKVIDQTDVYVPTAFTPNGDGLNDIFRPRYIGIASLEYFKVFDRWGRLVFSSNVLGAGWDGQNAVNGSYVYMISGKDLLGKPFSKQGSVVLIR